MEPDIFEYASEIQKNLADEATAVENYTKLLAIVPNGEDFDLISEIIADELNHQLVLQGIYGRITKIEPKKD